MTIFNSQDLSMKQILSVLETKDDALDSETTTTYFVNEEIGNFFEEEVLASSVQPLSIKDVSSLKDSDYLTFTEEGLEYIKNISSQDLNESQADQESDTQLQRSDQSNIQNNEAFNNITVASSVSENSNIIFGSQQNAQLQQENIQQQFANNVTSVATTGKSEVVATQLNFAVIPREEFSGLGSELTIKEKPVIIAVLSRFINHNGYPVNTTLFIKKMVSERFFPTQYNIYRKNLITNENFKLIKIIKSNETNIGPLFKNFIKTKLPQFTEDELILFTDRRIESNSLYVYKIEVIFDEFTSEIAEKIISTVVNSGSLFLGNLFSGDSS